MSQDHIEGGKLINLAALKSEGGKVLGDYPADYENLMREIQAFVCEKEEKKKDEKEEEEEEEEEEATQTGVVDTTTLQPVDDVVIALLGARGVKSADLNQLKAKGGGVLLGCLMHLCPACNGSWDDMCSRLKDGVRDLCTTL